METLDTLQTRLGEVCALNQSGVVDPHVVVALPSFSLAPSVLAHYGRRLDALEHRYLVSMLMLGRIPGCELVFVCSTDPGEEVVDYYLGLLPEAQRPGVRARLHVVTAPGAEPGPVAPNLLRNPAALARVRDIVGDRPAMLEPWNVTAAEVEVAARLGLPVNGTSPELWPLGFKSAGRRVFAQAGVPTPLGAEDVHDLAEVASAVARIRRTHPEAREVVVKHDNSGAGDGNLVIGLRDTRGNAVPRAALRRRIARAMPEWYRLDLRAGGVVEELVSGTSFASPSAQVDIAPDGSVAVLSTHEQVLAGDTGQVYSGCHFPADPAYTGQLAEHAAAVGEVLASRGARGRLSIDFVAVRRRRWEVFGIEVNLRKGGTTHPYTVLRNLVPGRFEAATGAWRADSGGVRCYTSTDSLTRPGWTGLPARAAIDAVEGAGLAFDRESGTGVVLHMLSGLAIDGRCGLTAIARTPAEGRELAAAAEEAVDAAARAVGGSA
jgi:hypothetical protein